MISFFNTNVYLFPFFFLINHSKSFFLLISLKNQILTLLILYWSFVFLFLFPPVLRRYNWHIITALFTKLKMIMKGNKKCRFYVLIYGCAVPSWSTGSPGWGEQRPPPPAVCGLSSLQGPSCHTHSTGSRQTGFSGLWHGALEWAQLWPTSVAAFCGTGIFLAQG